MFYPVPIMTLLSDLATILSPMVKNYHPESVLLVGDLAIKLYKDHAHSNTHIIQAPFNIDRLANITPLSLAIVSELIESVKKSEATEWIGLLHNLYVQQIIMITDETKTVQQGWELTDYLALGMKQVATCQPYHFFSYAITSYQLKKDWLNSRFWANPENFDKYRW